MIFVNIYIILCNYLIVIIQSIIQSINNINLYEITKNAISNPTLSDIFSSKVSCPFTLNRIIII